MFDDFFRFGHAALSRVTVAAIPSNYGRISFNGYELKVE